MLHVNHLLSPGPCGLSEDDRVWLHWSTVLLVSCGSQPIELSLVFLQGPPLALIGECIQAVGLDMLWYSMILLCSLSTSMFQKANRKSEMQWTEFGYHHVISIHVIFFVIWICHVQSLLNLLSWELRKAAGLHVGCRSQTPLFRCRAWGGILTQDVKISRCLTAWHRDRQHLVISCAIDLVET